MLSLPAPRAEKPRTLLDAPKITSLAPWFGNCRTGASAVGIQLGKLGWCGVPFAGGCPELRHIRTRGGIAADLHRHIINLARVVSDEDLHLALVERLNGVLFHPDELSGAQLRCIDRESTGGLFGAAGTPDRKPSVEWAADYFIASWMGMGGHAGKSAEFKQGLSIRWTCSGGDSARRFQSAIESLPAWHRAMKVWSFDLIDVFDFLPRVKDEDGYGLYIDAPWPGAGEEYKHRFGDAQQARLADKLHGFTKSRVVIRYGDHPMIRELYPETRWTWVRSVSKNQSGNDLAETLIVNGESFAGQGAK